MGGVEASRRWQEGRRWEEGGAGRTWFAAHDERYLCVAAVLRGHPQLWGKRKGSDRNGCMTEQ